MTLRLCFFGNSHIAALREAWRTNPGRWPEIEASFIGAHGDLLLQTEIREGRLHPVSAEAQDAFKRLNRLDSVDLAAPDAIIIVGCQMVLSQAVAIYRSMRWPGLPSLARNPDIASMKQPLVSYSAARATLSSVLSNRLGPALVRHLRPGTEASLWMLSQPRFSVGVLQTQKQHLKPYVVAVRSGDGFALSSLFDDAATHAAQSVGATFLPQNPRTYRRGMLTDAAYMSGAIRLATRQDLPQPADDIAHANGRYGAVAIDQVVAAVTGRPAGEVPELSDVEKGGE